MSPFRVTLVVTALALSSPFAQHRGDVVDLIRLVPRAFAFPYCCCCYLSLLCLRVAGSRVPNERRGSSCRAVVLLAFRVLRWLAEYSLQLVYSACAVPRRPLAFAASGESCCRCADRAAHQLSATNRESRQAVYSWVSHSALCVAFLVGIVYRRRVGCRCVVSCSLPAVGMALRICE